MPAKARRQRDLNNTQTTKIIKMHIAQPITILNVKCSSTLYSKALWTQPLLALKPNQTFLFIEGSTKLCLGVTQPPSSHATWFQMVIIHLPLSTFPPCDFDHFTPYFGQFSPLRLTLLPPVKWLLSPFSIISKITILSVFHKLLRSKELWIK